MMVPFLDLKRQSNRCRLETKRAIARVLDAGRYVLGPELEAFEAEFAASLNMPFAVGVGSGTDALTLALQATGIISPGRGDEVITTALSAAFTAIGICRAGAVPRFVDIDATTLQIDPVLAEAAITPRTRAILPVHLYGHCCDIEAITSVARRHLLAVIEDSCQAYGSCLGGHWLGTAGSAAGFSFYPTKNLGAIGDAGMLVTESEEICSRVRMLRHGGQSRTNQHELLGFNSRLDELQAAVLRTRLNKVRSGNERRRQLAARYDAEFADLDLAVLPVRPDFVPNRHLYPARTPRRDDLRRYLMECGIETLIHYPIPIPHQRAFRPFVLPGQTFPVAERATREVLSLPLYPELTEAELQYTVEAVRRFFKK